MVLHEFQISFIKDIVLRPSILFWVMKFFDVVFFESCVHVGIWFPSRLGRRGYDGFVQVCSLLLLGIILDLGGLRWLQVSWRIAAVDASEEAVVAIWSTDRFVQS